MNVLYECRPAVIESVKYDSASSGTCQLTCIVIRFDEIFNGGRTLVVMPENFHLVEVESENIAVIN